MLDAARARVGHRAAVLVAEEIVEVRIAHKKGETVVSQDEHPRADTTLEADYIILHVLLGTGNPEYLAKAARYILEHQNEDGGWGIYYQGPSNISASVKCYFGLKLAGYAADHPDLARGVMPAARRACA